MNLVEDAPRGDHPHDGGLAGTRGHLAGIAAERPVPTFGPLLLAGLVQRNVDPLREITPRFVEEDDRFGGFELGKEEPKTATLAPPVVQQLQRRGRDAGITSGSPLLDARSNQADQLQLDSGALWNGGAGGILRNRIRIVVDRGSTAGPLFRLGSLFKTPIMGRLLEW